MEVHLIVSGRHDEPVMPSQYHQPEDSVYDHCWMDHDDRVQCCCVGRNDLVFLEGIADS